MEVTQQGLSFVESLSKYTLFTVGDGLVSQIPALLVAVSAGIAVTRVSDKDTSLIGRDVFSQLGREPQALGTTAGVLFFLAFVPGFTNNFLLVNGVCFSLTLFSR